MNDVLRRNKYFHGKTMFPFHWNKKNCKNGAPFLPADEIRVVCLCEATSRWRHINSRDSYHVLCVVCGGGRGGGGRTIPGLDLRPECGGRGVCSKGTVNTLYLSAAEQQVGFVARS